jgi:hypothetical protein
MTGYQFFKEFVIPLAPAFVSLVVPIVVFYVIPLRWNRRQLALDLFSSFYGEEMRHARAQAWEYFIGALQESTPAGSPGAVPRSPRLRMFLQYLAEPATHLRIAPPEHEVFQKASRVLDFFTVVDGCIGRKTIDEGMVRDFLRYYYLWWRQEMLEPLRDENYPFPDQRLKPRWLRHLRHLDRTCEFEPKRRADDAQLHS